MPDALLDKVADAPGGAAAYGSAGERCMAISWLFALVMKTADALW